MARSPSTVAMRRIQNEMHDWLLNPPEGCKLESCEPMMRWIVHMTGPEEAGPFRGEVFRLSITFTERYPLQPPEIYSNGHICLDILYDSQNGGWSPALTMSKIALSLRSMLASATEKQRPAGDAEYCRRVQGRKASETHWHFDDDRV